MRKSIAFVRNDRLGGKLVGATWKQVLRATTFEGHCLSVYSIRHTATTLIADDAILNCNEARFASPSFCIHYLGCSRKMNIERSATDNRDYVN